jgi:sulfite exporter TauE/SafE
MSAVNLAGHLASVQRTATLIAGLALITFGVLSWGRFLIFPMSKSRHGEDEKASPFSRGLMRIRSKRSARTRAALMGMLTGLLPCGWLWAFVVTAGGTGHVLGGLGVMVFFWLGTVPAMVGVLGFMGPALARVRAKMPAITAVALIAVGLATLALRWHDAGQATHCYLCTGAGS